MNLWDILILLAVAGLVYLAVRALRSGRSGACHGNCAACRSKCRDEIPGQTCRQSERWD